MIRRAALAVVAVMVFLVVLAEIQGLDDAALDQLAHQRAYTANQ